MNLQHNDLHLLRLPVTRHAGWLALLRDGWRQLRRWRELARQRRQLASLSDATLKDIGYSRADIEQEAARPFWDDPLRR
ncbi:DUF1127 domain-containing protein [Stutzerimonas stutzeri]|uniref:DUF1127 domain-containing protein n=1 Tax=Stutzerimonas sp. S1 TaxID=3030652 RepID=UPI0022258DC4|nr:DUF1127 domain-containing protein [Stutzerimonas sp. S1]MCW3150212.1 DUF1127 domain-containing protein [Stutzerimonas sp. S1]